MSQARIFRQSARMLTGLSALYLAACGGSASRDAHDSTGGMSSGAHGGSAAAGQGATGARAEGGTGVTPGSGGASAVTGGVSSFTGGTSSSGSSGAPNTGAAGAGFELPPNGPTWKTSITPFCAGQAPWVDAADVRSNAESVFALVESTVYQNSGSGWSPLFESPTLAFGDLTGFADGPLVLTARSASRCGILFLDGDGLRCSGAAQNVYSVFPVERTLAYAIANGRLLVYRGDFWTQVGGALALNGTFGADLWADAQQAIATGGPGEVLRYDLESDTTSALPPYSDSAEALALWGFGEDDYWLATDAGELLHYDGESWRLVFTVQGPCGNIRGMWGQAGVLYFYTPSTVYRLQENQVEPILSLPCDDWEALSVRNLWGNSPSEVFIALQNYRVDEVVRPDGAVENVVRPADSCGAIRLLYFDGERVGQL